MIYFDSTKSNFRVQRSLKERICRLWFPILALGGAQNLSFKLKIVLERVRWFTELWQFHRKVTHIELGIEHKRNPDKVFVVVRQSRRVAGNVWRCWREWSCASRHRPWCWRWRELIWKLKRFVIVIAVRLLIEIEAN